MSNEAISPDKDDISYVFQNLIIYFLERQRLVMLAMLDISPVLLIRCANSVPIDLAPYIELFHHKQTNIQSSMDLYRGVWKKDWEYRLHGIGCKLTNVNTLEIIEWDAIDSKAFRFDWFLQHLTWRKERDFLDPFVSKYATLYSDISEADILKILVNENAVILDLNNLCFLNK